jgi:hypothetical protein
VKTSEIIAEASNMKRRLGGEIFAFPVRPEDPFSTYGVVVYAGSKYHVYPEAVNISMAAQGILTIIEEYQKIGKKINYEKDVRLVSYEAQINAPDVTMRRIRNSPDNYTKL